MTPFKFTVPDSEEFLKIVDKADFIIDYEKNRFLKFAQAWYEDEPDFSLVNNRKHYIEEWIDRFKHGVEYLDSDYTRLGYLLFKVDGENRGKHFWARQLAKYNNTTAEKLLPEIEEKIEEVKAFLARKGKLKGIYIPVPQRKRAAPKKRAPPIRVDFRKML